MSTDAVIQSLATAINTSWRKSTDSVLETAKLCANANEKLKVDERKKLVAQLDCGQATFSKLAKIGSRPELQSDTIRSLLPPNYTIVYEVAKLPKPELDAAVEKGIINHRMTRADLAAWLAERTGGGKTKTIENPHRVIGTLQVPLDYDGSRQSQLEKDLEKLRAKYGFSLERPRDPEQAAFNRMARQIDDFIRGETRRFIKELKKRRMSNARKLSAAERKKLWGFKEDDTAIAPDATWEQVRAVLEMVGNGDQFERIRDEALRLFGLPEDVVSSHPIEDHDEAMRELRTAYEQFNGGAKLGMGKVNPNQFAGWK